VDRTLSLDEPYRSVVLLSVFDDLSTKRIAKRLGRPRNTIQTQLRRGLEKLRERLDRSYGDRRSWGLALLPLAGGESAAKVAAAQGSSFAALGGWILLLKALSAVSLVALVAVLGNHGLVPAEHELAGELEPSPPLAAVAPTAVDAAPAALVEREAVGAGPIEVPAHQDPAADALLARGQVVDVTGSILANVEVRWGSAEAENEERTITDGDGRFEVADRAGARFLETEGLVLVGVGARQQSDQSREHLLVVERAAEVTGLVVDQQGLPVEGAYVSAGFSLDSVPGFPFDRWKDMFSGLEVHRDWHAETDAFGRFDLGNLPMLEWLEVVADKRGYVADRAFLPLDPVVELTFTLGEKERIFASGRVFDANGSAAARVQVFLGQDQTTSESDGTFEVLITCLIPEAALTAYRRGFQPGVVGGVASEMKAAGTSREGLEVHLGPPTMDLSGVVSDASGKPVAGAIVSLVDPTVLSTSTFYPEDEEVCTSAKGEFRMGELSNRDYRLRVVDPKARRAFVTKPLRPAAGIDLRFEEEDDLFTLVGRVVDARGTPVAKAEIYHGLVRTKKTFWNGSSTRYVDVDRTRSDAVGLFTLDSVSAHAELRISGDGIEPLTLATGDLDRDVAVVPFEVKLFHRFRVLARPQTQLDACEFHGPSGQVSFRAIYPDLNTERARLRFDASPLEPVLEVPADATHLVLFAGGEEVERLELHGDREGITEICIR